MWNTTRSHGGFIVDVVRKKSKSRKWLRWAFLLIVLSGAIAGTTYGLSTLEKALPEFKRTSVIIDEVQHGTMVRNVRGPGTLIPKDITFVTTEVSGTVVEVFVEAGDQVEKDTVLLKLRDRQMERSIRDAERAVASAKASVDRFLLQDKANQLSLKVSRETARANFANAREDAELNETLARRGLISLRQWQISRDQAERSRMLFEVQIERELNSQETMEIQLKERQESVTAAEDSLVERRELQAALTVKASVSGVLQSLGSTGAGLEVGQRVAQGASVAIITDPSQLRAELQISQTQARDVVVGQPTEIDTRNGIIEGRVTRIDPAVQNDRVTVDVELIGDLPRGARPDLSVEGLIEVSRLNDVTHVRKPAFSREHRPLEVFRLEPDGETAVRTLVELGTSSVYRIEVVSGLKAGDQIVVSETSRWKALDRVRLK